MELLQDPRPLDEKSEVLLREIEDTMVAFLEKGADVETDVFTNIKTVLPVEVGINHGRAAAEERPAAGSGRPDAWVAYWRVEDSLRPDSASEQQQTFLASQLLQSLMCSSCSPPPPTHNFQPAILGCKPTELPAILPAPPPPTPVDQAANMLTELIPEPPRKFVEPMYPDEAFQEPVMYAKEDVAASQVESEVTEIKKAVLGLKQALEDIRSNTDVSQARSTAPVAALC
eukprot:358480-Chlamydomonas_euryale.AAC.10